MDKLYYTYHFIHFSDASGPTTHSDSDSDSDEDEDEEVV